MKFLDTNNWSKVCIFVLNSWNHIITISVKCSEFPLHDFSAWQVITGRSQDRRKFATRGKKESNLAATVVDIKARDTLPSCLWAIRQGPLVTKVKSREPQLNLIKFRLRIDAGKSSSLSFCWLSSRAMRRISSNLTLYHINWQISICVTVLKIPIASKTLLYQRI